MGCGLICVLINFLAVLEVDQCSNQLPCGASGLTQNTDQLHLWQGRDTEHKSTSLHRKGLICVLYLFLAVLWVDLCSDQLHLRCKWVDLCSQINFLAVQGS